MPYEGPLEGYPIIQALSGISSQTTNDKKLRAWEQIEKEIGHRFSYDPRLLTGLVYLATEQRSPARAAAQGALVQLFGGRVSGAFADASVAIAAMNEPEVPRALPWIVSLARQYPIDEDTQRQLAGALLSLIDDRISNDTTWNHAIDGLMQLGYPECTKALQLVMHRRSRPDIADRAAREALRRGMIDDETTAAVTKALKEAPKFVNDADGIAESWLRVIEERARSSHQHDVRGIAYFALDDDETKRFLEAIHNDYGPTIAKIAESAIEWAATDDDFAAALARDEAPSPLRLRAVVEALGGEATLGDLPPGHVKASLRAAAESVSQSPFVALLTQAHDSLRDVFETLSILPEVVDASPSHAPAREY